MTGRTAFHPLTACARRPWLTVVAAAFLAEGLFLAFYVAPISHALDFYHVNFVPAVVKQGFDVYDSAQHRAAVDWIARSTDTDSSQRLDCCLRLNHRIYPTGMCPTATPLLYTVHSFGLVGSFDFRFWLFHLTATAAGLLGLYLIARASGFDRQMSWLICGLGTSFCVGLFLDAQLANVSRFQILGLGLVVFLAQRGGKWGMAAAAAALAFGCAYKPTILPSLGLFFVVLTVDRRWRDLWGAIGGSLAGAAVGFLLPLFLFGSLDCWWGWRRYASHELSLLASYFPGNYSLQAAVDANHHLVGRLLPLGLGATLVAGFIWRPVLAKSGPTSIAVQDLRLRMAVVVGPLWTVLSSPLTWVQYSALVLPLTIVLLGIPRRDFRHPRCWLIFVLVGGLISAGLVQRLIPMEIMWIDAGLFWTGWLSMYCISLWWLVTAKRPARESRHASKTAEQSDRPLERFSGCPGWGFN